MTRTDYYDARNAEGIPFAMIGGSLTCTSRAPDAADGADARPALCDLRPIATLEMRGSDAAKFLQGYLTCDLGALDGEHWCTGALCNLQGRMVGNFIVSGDAACVRMRMPATSLPIVSSALAKYAVFARAKLRDATDEWIGFGLIGIAAVGAARRLGYSASDVAGMCCSGPDFELLVRAHDRCDLWLAPARAESVWTQLANELGVDGYARWLGAEVAAGFAWVTSDTTDTHLPQAFNLDVYDGVSFSKGCYLGQEIVTRVQHRSSSKRRLYRLALRPRATLGATVQLGDGREAGRVVQIGRSASGASEGLAVLERSAASQPLQIEGEPVELLKLPYASTD